MNTDLLESQKLAIEHVEHSIIVIRGQRVMLDSQLARLYGVTTKRLNEQIKRNQERFPPDFMFRITGDEYENLRSQFATSSLVNHGGRRYLPNVFTEYGAIMAANVLNSKHAIEMSILIVRVFAKFRYLFGAHIELAQKIAELENQFKDKTREQTIHINKIYKILDALMVPPPQPKKGHMGFDPGRT